MAAPLMSLFTMFMASSVSVKDCSNPSYPSVFNINALSISPESPTPGQQVALYMEYTVPQGIVVEDGTAKYDVTYNFIPMPPTTEPLCANVPCPLTSGAYANTTSTPWPSGIRGTITTKISWLDTNNSLLACVLISGKILSSS